MGILYNLHLYNNGPTGPGGCNGSKRICTPLSIHIGTNTVDTKFDRIWFPDREFT